MFKSLISKGIAKDPVNHLEDVVVPPLLNVFYVDMVTIGVMSWDVCVTHFDLARIIEADKIDYHIGVFRPLLKLPFHLDLYILLNLLVNPLN